MKKKGTVIRFVSKPALYSAGMQFAFRTEPEGAGCPNLI